VIPITQDFDEPCRTVGTISERKRSNGSFGYAAPIVINKAGVRVHTQAQTFDRAPSAQAWTNGRQAEIARDGFAKPTTTLGETLVRYVTELIAKTARTKAHPGGDPTLPTPSVTSPCST